MWWTVKTDKFTLFVYCNFLVLLSTTVCSQNINKQNENIADKTLSDYSFLSRYHYTKSKNYVKRRYRIRHWISMFIGTPCRLCRLRLRRNNVLKSCLYFKKFILCFFIWVAICTQSNLFQFFSNYLMIGIDNTYIFYVFFMEIKALYFWGLKINLWI